MLGGRSHQCAHQRPLARYDEAMLSSLSNAPLALSTLALAMMLFSGGCSQQQAPDQIGEGSVKIEGDTPQFPRTVEEHLRDPGFRFVYISWFPKPNLEEFAEINSAGSGTRGWMQAGNSGEPILLTRVGPSSVGEIHELLKQLPASGQNIPQHSTVIITYQDGTEFHTRTYDRFAIPPPLHHIWHIIAAPGMAMDCTPSTQS
jgi:hypothetical protein